MGTALEIYSEAVSLRGVLSVLYIVTKFPFFISTRGKTCMLMLHVADAITSFRFIINLIQPQQI